jgi:hypothetical protein
MFGNWLNKIEKKTKAQICVGIHALEWAIWNCRNDIVFNKGNAHFLQVIHMVNIGSTSGPSFSQMCSMHLWILAAANLRWLLGHFTTRVAGSFLEEFMMHKHLVLVFFRLLIFMYTLCDP